ncbi:MAG TPA: type II CAAX endopeptidase family protein [Propionibacteriaceae bacterium]
MLTSTAAKQSGPGRTGLSQLVRRHPLAAFLVLTYGLSWALWIPLDIFRDATSGPFTSIALLIGSNVPSVVAIVLTAVGFGKGATRKLLGQLLIWRVGWRWYLVLLAPTALVVGTITLVAVTRGGPTAALAMPLLNAIFFVAFMTFPGSAVGEEIGWRGFALPRLQARRTALTASLVVGSLHGLWHLPLWLRGDADHRLSAYPAFLIQALALAVIYTWLYNNTKGSLLIVALFHTATNAPLTLVLLPLGIENWILPFWLMAGFTVVAAVVVVAVFGPTNLSRHPRQTQPATPADAATP